jgi:DNA polymerase-3 subunit chi
MIEIAFYHLTRRSLEQTLPVMLERSLARGWRAVVQATSEQRLKRLDEFLWSYRPDSFLAHGKKSDGAPESQPIYLTIETDNPNSAEARFFVEGALIAPILETPGAAPRERAILLFDDFERDAAREQWKDLLASGHRLTYWQENEDGKFEKKMEKNA